MKCVKVVVFTLLILFSIKSGDICFGFEIIKPESGATFHPGDKISVELKTEATEILNGVWFYTQKMSESDFDFVPPYIFEFTVHPEFTGIETIVANGKLEDNSIIESRIQINVVLPNNIVLDKLMVEPPKIYLSKVPEGTHGAHYYVNKQLDALGLYSDGDRREITSSSSGTSYTSSNDEVVTVSPEGYVTAQAVGKAKVTVSNGNYSATVDVVVKPYGN